jgi:hypothetical protein
LALTLSTRASGLLLGNLAAAPSSGEAAWARLALAHILAEELLRPDPDIGALARRWAGAAVPVAALDAGSVSGFEHLRDTGQPRMHRMPATAASLPLHLLPVALLAFENPRTLTSLTWHLATLTHPEPESSWGAVAVNVAAARLLQGHRDFVPDVIEVLRNNDAPPLLLETVRRLPLLRRENIDGLALNAPPAIASTCAALWAAHTESRTATALEWLERLPVPLAAGAAVGAGLLGARDGIEALRIALQERGIDIDAVRRVADQLARITPPDAPA